MKATYRWIKEHCNFEISPEEMLRDLMMLGHEVDDAIDLGMLDNPIRIARIVAVEPHPNADALTICRVDDGSGEEASVVCGAPNVKAGLVGVLGRVGARLPNGMVLKRSKIRGVTSEGMLLAPDEMGLGSEHEGIVVLPPDAPIGEEIRKPRLFEAETSRDRGFQDEHSRDVDPR